MKVYVLTGDPIPLARPRFTHRDTDLVVYDSQRQNKLVSKITLATQRANDKPLQGPIVLNVTFFFRIPIAKKKTRLPNDPHISRPDLSNIVKYIEDVCQNVGIIKDDCIIVQLNATKLYDHNPRTEFYFEEYHGKKEK